MLKFNLAESVRNKFVIETKTSLDSGSVSTHTGTEPSVPQSTLDSGSVSTPTGTEPSVPQSALSLLEPTGPTLTGASSGPENVHQLNLPTMAEPPTTLHLAQNPPVLPIGSENEHLPTIIKPTTPQIANSEVSLPASATASGLGHEHDNDFTISRATSITSDTTAHLGGGLALRDLNVNGTNWHNSTGGWDFGGLGMGDGMGMVPNDINNGFGLGWSLIDELMDPNLPLLPESLLPVPALPTQRNPDLPLLPELFLPVPALPTQQNPNLPLLPESLLPVPASPTQVAQQFLSTASPSILPQAQPNVPLAFASGKDVESQSQANDEGDLAPRTDLNAKTVTSDMDVESGERLGTRNRRKPTESREVVPLTARHDSDKLPDWLELASKYLYDGVEACEWKECLDIWMAFEKEVGYLEMTAVSATAKFTYISLRVFQHRLVAKLRPQVVSKWLQNRQYQAIPKIDDVKTYANEWLAWWNGLQPKWRQNEVPNTLPPPLSTAGEKENVSNLKKGGPSGLVTVLIALKWWAHDQDPEWKAAVKDVKDCLESFAGVGSKRKAGAVPGHIGSKKMRTA